MLAEGGWEAFDDDGWWFEPKLDGIRCLAFKRGSEVRLMTRNKIDRAASFPKVAAAVEKQAGDFIIDGEVVATGVGRTKKDAEQEAAKLALESLAGESGRFE